MRYVGLLAGIGLLLAAGATAGATTTVEFDPLQLRQANDASGEFGTITEWANGNGVDAVIPKAGQKVCYGTQAFNGYDLADLDYIEFTYKRANGGNNPYTNAVITDGATNYGVISSQGGYTLWETVGPSETEKRMRYYFAGDSGNQAYGFRFYEPAGSPPWGHGTNLTWSDISTWDLLGVGVSRPLSAGEGDVPIARAPVDHGIGIMWGDSADNYLGTRQIYDVVVSADGQEFSAGVIPEPVTMAGLMLGIGCLARYVRRRKA